MFCQHSKTQLLDGDVIIPLGNLLPWTYFECQF